MRRLAAVIIGTTFFLAAGCADRAAPAACDRSCLIGMADRYLAAVLAHDPSAVPLAANLLFVENVTAMKPGEGLWTRAAGEAPSFRIHVPDPDQGTVGLIAVIQRHDGRDVSPAMLALRLAVKDGTIVEAEHLIGEVGPTADPSRLTRPRPGLTATIPEPERMPRSAIAAVAASYYDALVAADAGRAPFAADCERQENGMIAAGPGLPPAPFDSVDVNGRRPPAVARDCIGQLNSRRFAYIDAIDHRRVFAIDPVRGLAMGLSHFRQSMTRGPQRLIAADGSQMMWEEKRDPYDLPAAHIFKIAGGQIHEVEAIGIFVPYGSATGWAASQKLRILSVVTRVTLGVVSLSSRPRFP